MILLKNNIENIVRKLSRTLKEQYIWQPVCLILPLFLLLTIDKLKKINIYSKIATVFHFHDN